MTETEEAIRILYMEDDVGLARLLQRRLRRHGYDVDLSYDGKQGLAMYEAAREAKRPYDVVIIDHQMPVYDGLQVMRLISEADLLPPTIMITGAGNEDIAIEAMKLGAKDYLVKDIDTRYLTLLPAVIEQVIGSERLKTIVANRTKELADVRDQLVRQEKLTILGSLASSVGNKLRGPLSVVTNAVYLLKATSASEGDETSDYLDLIDVQVSEANKILSSLLSLSLIRPAIPRASEPLKLIHDVLMRCPEPDGVVVQVDVGSGLPFLWGDSEQVVHLLMMLVVNAYEAVGEQGTVTIRAMVEGAQLLIYVQDNGAGISDEVMAQIFEPLFSTKEKGVGLGLAIAQSLAQLNGGRIRVISEVGNGASFVVYLPIQE